MPDRKRFCSSLLILTAFLLSTSLFLLYLTSTPLPSLGIHKYLQPYLPSSHPSHTCPSTFHPRRTLSFPPENPSNTCFSPPTTSPEFSLTICTSPTICNAFTLTLLRTSSSSCDGPGRTLSTDKELEEEIINTLGPDDFRLDVRGAEMYSAGPTRRVEEGCGYVWDVALQNAGVAEVQVILIHSDYKAFDELDLTFPPIISLPILPAAFLLPPCSALCPTLSLPPFPLPAQLPSYHSSILAPSLALYPSCPITRSPLPGSYLPRPPRLLNGTFNDPFPLLPPQAPESTWETATLPPYFVGQYGLQPDGCVWRHGGMRFTPFEVAGCGWERERRLEWVGDSHARVVFDACYHRLAGEVDYLTSSAKQGEKHYQLGSTTFRFRWDPLADLLNDVDTYSCAHLSTLTTLVISLGAHHASRGATLASYTSALTFLTRLASCPSPPNLIFVLTPPAPRRDDPAVHTLGDHRTQPRLIAFNKAVMDLALGGEEWMVVDQMGLLRPWEDWPLRTDKAHFLATDGLEAVVDEVVGKMGIC